MSRYLCLFILLVVCVVSLNFSAPAETVHPFTLTWYTVDGGGQPSSAGGYMLTGTMGQPDAHAPLEAQPYRLAGGFWTFPPPPKETNIYLPIVMQ